MNLYLTTEEQQQIDNLVPKYKWAQVLWNISIPGDSDSHFVVDKADAWEWKDVVDAERKGFLPRAQGDLRAKLHKFYERIS